MMTRVCDYCDKYSMIPPASRVLCAVSGGADSIAMLHILLELSKKQGFFVCCAHYNHGIRGEEALRDEEFVSEVCQWLGVPVKIGRGDVPDYASKNKLGIEEAARVLRYAFLEAAADELSCAKIATAHNACDNAETVLMNLMRGAGLRGACGIAPVRGRIIRPLLCLDRPEIESYLTGHGIEYVDDSTNFSDEYSRNRLRHNVMEPLRRLSSDFGAKILSACETMREDEEYLAAQAARFLQIRNGEISAKELAALDRPVAARVVMLLAPAAGREHISTVLELAGSEKAHGRLSLPGAAIIKQYDCIRFGACEEEPLVERVLMPGKVYETGRYTIFCREGTAERKNKQGHDFFCFKNEKICGNIKVSTRKNGDKLCIKNRGITKSLKKLFSEAKIPPALRGGIPVIRDDAGVLAVCGFGEDERAAACPGEKAIIVEVLEKCVEDAFDDKK